MNMRWMTAVTVSVLFVHVMSAGVLDRAAQGVPHQYGASAPMVAPTTTTAQATISAGYAVRLQVATVDTRAGNIGAGLRALATSRQTLSARRMLPVLVQFAGPITDADKAALAKAGCVIHGYVPDNALLVEAPADNTDALAAAPALHWLGE